MSLVNCIALPKNDRHAKYLRTYQYNDCYEVNDILFFRVKSKQGAIYSLMIAQYPINDLFLPYSRFPTTSWYCRIEEKLFPVKPEAN